MEDALCTKGFSTRACTLSNFITLFYEASKPAAKTINSHALQEDAEDAFFNKANLEGKVAGYVELLKFKNLSVGMKLWAVILEVSSRGLTLSLPHGLRAHVAANEVRSCCSDLCMSGTALISQPELTFHALIYSLHLLYPGSCIRHPSCPSCSHVLQS